MLETIWVRACQRYLTGDLRASQAWLIIRGKSLPQEPRRSIRWCGWELGALSGTLDHGSAPHAASLETLHAGHCGVQAPQKLCRSDPGSSQTLSSCWAQAGPEHALHCWFSSTEAEKVQAFAPCLLPVIQKGGADGQVVWFF